MIDGHPPVWERSRGWSVFVHLEVVLLIETPPAKSGAVRIPLSDYSVKLQCCAHCISIPTGPASLGTT